MFKAAFDRFGSYFGQGQATEPVAIDRTIHIDPTDPADRYDVVEEKNLAEEKSERPLLFQRHAESAERLIFMAPQPKKLRFSTNILEVKKLDRKRQIQRDTKHIQLYMKARDSGFKGSDEEFQGASTYLSDVLQAQVEEELKYAHTINPKYVMPSTTTLKSTEHSWIRDIRQRFEQESTQLRHTHLTPRSTFTPLSQPATPLRRQQTPVKTQTGMRYSSTSQIIERTVKKPSTLLDDMHKRELELTLAIKKLRLTAEHERTYPPLTSSQLNITHRIFKQGLDEDVVIQKYNYSISRGDLRTLCPGVWLNDMVINYYGVMLQERTDQSNGELEPAHFFNSFFVGALRKGFGNVKRWTKKFDLFSKSFVVFPVHLGNHWCTARINFLQKRIEYYDSLQGTNESLFALLRSYLDEEHKAKKGVPFDFNSWVNWTVQDIPVQMNGYDCGVFTCVNIDHLLRDAEMGYSQVDMPYFRKKIVWEIAEGRVHTRKESASGVGASGGVE